MKHIKTAVIGVGNMGRNHARVYHEISNLVAISDLNEKQGMELSKRFNINYYKNFKEMLEIEDINAVSIAVPTENHKQIAEDVLKRKTPVLLEKPISNTVKKAEEILEVAKKTQTFLMIGHIERFNPAVIKLKKLISESRLGKLISIVSIRVGISPPKTFKSDVVLDLAIHDVDIFNYLLDEFPKDQKIIRKKIFENNIADSSSMLLNYEDCSGLIQSNWITPIKIRKLYVTGTDGFVELDYILQKIVLHNKLILKRQSSKNNKFFDFISLSDSSKQNVYVYKKEPLMEELKYFLSNLKSKDYSIADFSIKALKSIT